MKNEYMITNAAIWTANRDQPWADSLVVSENKIKSVGTYKRVKQDCDSDVKEINLGGKLVIPAILDSHIHIAATAKTLWCYLLERKDYGSIREILTLIKEYAEKNPKEKVPYIYAYSCPTNLMDEDDVDRYLLDQYVSDRPVMLCDENYHRCLVNSRMLELMEVDENTPYYPNTSCNYERYEDNTPNGIIEEHAYEFYHDIEKMFEKIDWTPPSEADPEVISPILDYLTNHGVCGVHDGFTESEDTLIGLKKLEEQGNLHHYFHAMPLMHKPEQLEEAIERAKRWKENYEDDYICIDSVKFLLDGTNELGTGAVIDPLCTDPNDFGIINASENQMTKIFRRLNQEKLNIQIHLVGDRAFRVALNAAEKAQAAEKAEGRAFTSRVTLLHCELTHPDDRKRPGKLGVFINFTPIWAGGIFGDAARQYLGDERFNSMYAFKDMIQTGAIVNFSSDIVDEEGLPYSNPFIGIEIGHRRIDSKMGNGLRESAAECLSLEDLLRGYTINNALGMGIAGKTGSLEAGKMANLCILSQNLFEVPADQIRNTQADTVIFEGEVIKGELK